jgi:hypothetical protein
VRHRVTHSFHDCPSLLHIYENMLARMKHLKCVNRLRRTDRQLDSSLVDATFFNMPESGSRGRDRKCQVSDQHLGLADIMFMCL